MEDWIYLATLANYLLKALAMSKGFLLNDSREHCTKNEFFHYRYTNADLKISPYVCVHIKTIS